MIRKYLTVTFTVYSESDIKQIDMQLMKYALMINSRRIFKSYKVNKIYGSASRISDNTYTIWFKCNKKESKNFLTYFYAVTENIITNLSVVY
jgi:hypothetical protein